MDLVTRISKYYNCLLLKQFPRCVGRMSQIVVDRGLSENWNREMYYTFSRNLALKRKTDIRRVTRRSHRMREVLLCFALFCCRTGATGRYLNATGNAMQKGSMWGMEELPEKLRVSWRDLPSIAEKSPLLLRQPGAGIGAATNGWMATSSNHGACKEFRNHRQ